MSTISTLHFTKLDDSSCRILMRLQSSHDEIGIDLQDNHSEIAPTAMAFLLELFENKQALMEGCHNWFKLSLGNSSAAIARAKAILGKGYESEAFEFGNIFQTAQMIEGTTAFLEKRKAIFTGK